MKSFIYIHTLVGNAGIIEEDIYTNLFDSLSTINNCMLTPMLYFTDI